MKPERYIRIEYLSTIIIRMAPILSVLSLFGSQEASFGRYQAFFWFTGCELLLEAFLIWNYSDGAQNDVKIDYF